jgi:ATP-dependent Lon protease
MRKEQQDRTILRKPMLPLRDLVVFPNTVMPLFVGREKSISALEYAMTNNTEIVLAAQRIAKTNDPKESEIFSVGTLASIIQLLRLPDGTVKALVEGKSRVRILNYVPEDKFFMVDCEELPEIIVDTLQSQALVRSVHSTFENYVKLNKKLAPEILMTASNIEDPSKLSDTIASQMVLKLEDKQGLLEMDNVAKRLDKLLKLMQGEIEILLVERRIQNRVKRQMEKTQKEYYLNEQMQAIQKELGEKDDYRSEMQEIEEKIKKKGMSKEALEKAEKELKKLKMMSPMSAEATVSRNYIDWLISIPWKESTKDKLDINEAEEILEKDHYGLKKVKERILEYLAVQSLVDKIKGPILCFVGPPGVGKTSLAQSIASALGRKFVRMSLGGVRDEAEIRGHRRTYIGAMPGKIMQYMKKAGTVNPLVLLDEIDKMSMDFRGDPSAALLEVLDPEQNHTFNDHYLDVDYDLSRVMFITTANSLHNVPRALEDRMEVLRLPGYTELEKLNIAKKFLVKKQLEANGLNSANIKFSESSLKKIIRLYTKEAGVRNLEREAASICRKIAKEILKHGKDHAVTITGKSIRKYLGIQKYRYGLAEEKDMAGVTTGLAWTDVGGELLTCEVAIMPGTGKLIVTGKLGDVMQESARAAMSYVRSRASSLGLKRDFYQKIDIHIHVPEGAIPKDGPSAGITMATAIISALLKVPVKKDIAMTGEITLRGRILPIGGLKEKILAAHRGNIKTVIIPKENEKDLADIPKRIRKELMILLADHMDEVLIKAVAIDNPKEFLDKLRKPDIDIFATDETKPDPAIAKAEKIVDEEIINH